MNFKHETRGAKRQLILKPEPVHGTAHSVVVRQLLNGACWTETEGTVERISSWHEPLRFVKAVGPLRYSPTAATAGHLS